MADIKIDRARELVRRALITSLSAMAISIGSCVNVTKNSHIRAVEAFSLVTLGVCIGVFAASLVLTLKLKKEQ